MTQLRRCFSIKNFRLDGGGVYGNEYRNVYLLTTYLATNNNLSSAVLKSMDKTMKIMYTLTEEAADFSYKKQKGGFFNEGILEHDSGCIYHAGRMDWLLCGRL